MTTPPFAVGRRVIPTFFLSNTREPALRAMARSLVDTRGMRIARVIRVPLSARNELRKLQPDNSVDSAHHYVVAGFGLNVLDHMAVAAAELTTIDEARRLLARPRYAIEKLWPTRAELGLPTDLATGRQRSFKMEPKS